MIKCNTTYLESAQIINSVNSNASLHLLLKSPKSKILPSLGTMDLIYSFNTTRLNVGSRFVFCHILLPDGTKSKCTLDFSFSK